MARYYYHLVDGIFLPDSVGEEFETLADAQREAVSQASAAVVARQGSFWKSPGVRIIVTNVVGDLIFELNLKGQSYPSAEPERTQ